MPFDAKTLTQVRNVLGSLMNEKSNLESAINATPTSVARNALTDANIHLHETIAALQSANRLISSQLEIAHR